MAQIVIEQRLLGALNATAGNSTTTPHNICFSDVWIQEEAHFRPCFLPVIAGIPAVVAAAILLIQALRMLIPFRPKWTQPFIPEIAEPVVEIDLVTKRRWTAFTTTLAALTILGFGLQLAASILTGRTNAIAFLPLLPWLVAIIEVVLYRPRSVPYSVLTIMITQVIAASILLEHNLWEPSASRVLSICALTTAGLALVLLSLMPMRDPFLPAKDISKPFGTPAAVLRSPEEALNIWQYMTVSWMSPLMSVGNARQLETEDVWSLPYEFQHRRLHETFRQLRGTVLMRLIKANALDLILVTTFGVLDMLCQYAAPVFLQLILSSMQDPTGPKRVPLTYAALSLCARLLAAQIGVFQLWYGRRCYERSRGEMITMLYEKTLDRKIAFKQEDKESKTANGDHANGHDVQKKKKTWLGRTSGRIRSWFSLKKEAPVPKEPAVMGKILNLMRNDVYEVAQRFWEFDNLIKKPFAIFLSISLVVNYLGAPALMAVGLVIAANIVNALIARVLVHYEKQRRVATDAKLSIISEFVEAIRHLRWYGWQGEWLSKVLSARQLELNKRIIATIWGVAMAVVNVLALNMTPVVAFAAYTLITKKPLTVDIGFASMQLLAMMASQMKDLPQLVISLVNAWVAVVRIEDYMAEPDRQEMTTEARIGDKLALENATFAWPGASGPILKSVSLEFEKGLTVIRGEVGSGKTALLQALLGEMDLLSGELIRPPDALGYCAQTPWLQSMSIRDNILFSAPYEEARYRAVLEACALISDLAEFKAGDLSLIGENGVGLSGGQRARVALARALYSRTQILLLDDPLAALDQQTADSIVSKCFTDGLLSERITVLVTHRTELVLHSARMLVTVEHGQALESDRQAAIDDLQLGARTVQAEQTPASEGETDANPAKANDAAIPEKFIEDEHREYGGVRARVYWEYIKAGDLRLWALMVTVLIIFRLFALAEQWFVKAWGEAYSTRANSTLYAFTEDSLPVHAEGLFDSLPSPDVDIKPWLVGFAALALAQTLAYSAYQGMIQVIVYTAARNMFRDIIEKVTYATFRFYDVTPVGRLMNRMTSDIGVIDGGISIQFSVISWMLIGWVSAVVVIASITPLFLVFVVLLAVLFYLIFKRFIPTSQNLRRLEMVSLTPLMSNFGELLNGLATVRAFCAQARFQDRVVNVVDTFQKMDHFYWSLQAWLQYRYDALAALATFMLLVLALATDLSPGLTAFALVSASRFVITTHNLCRQYGQLQMEFVSVERIVELLNLEQEPKGSIQPPAWWPSFSGDIVFKDVVIKYAPHLDPALAGVSFTVKGGSKTAVIGRTGSGKSTLALSMLATILPDMGSILVDNIDLAEVDKQLLRTRVTFLAQDPVLFPGTMRQNLDPVKEHTDEECSNVLRRVCERQNWGLDTRFEAGGKNLSQGQRQLVGLARAVLRRSAIIILDEATASIDRETAMQIQQVMHEEMKNSTVITIAHRLEAVRNADYCIVLGKGKIIEQGPAAEMLRDHQDEVVENVDEQDE